VNRVNRGWDGLDTLPRARRAGRALIAEWRYPPCTCRRITVAARRFYTCRCIPFGLGRDRDRRSRSATEAIPRGSSGGTNSCLCSEHVVSSWARALAVLPISRGCCDRRGSLSETAIRQRSARWRSSTALAWPAGSRTARREHPITVLTRHRYHGQSST